VDLLGGTTGQVLSKTSATDLDFTWVTANPGDITGVTAGTGISGGGTSGTVTVTNDMATTITAAGDIVVGTGSGTYDNLPIGTTAQVLTADTTVSPYKVKWATPAGGGGKILQVVQATNSTQMTSFSTSFADSNLTATITPTLNTSKILVIVSQMIRIYKGANYQAANWKLLRDATAIVTYNYASDMGIMFLEAGAGAVSMTNNVASTYLDSPATTSATTYKTQISVADTASSGYSRAQPDSTLSTITLLEVGA
jgi:hypothetical protein